MSGLYRHHSSLTPAASAQARREQIVEHALAMATDYEDAPAARILLCGLQLGDGDESDAPVAAELLTQVLDWLLDLAARAQSGRDSDVQRYLDALHLTARPGDRLPVRGQVT